MDKEIQQEMVYGIRPVLEAVDAGKEVEKVLIQKGLRSTTFTELMQILKEHSVPYQFVPVEKLNRITRKNHQGIVAYISPVAFYRV
ncbi:MAG: 23S rRNA (guanosine(2251)-2'-O)-methyltransferase RlmB, partial [Bacteroidetes bacterium]